MEHRSQQNDMTANLQESTSSCSKTVCHNIATHHSVGLLTPTPPLEPGAGFDNSEPPEQGLNKREKHRTTKQNAANQPDNSTTSNTLRQHTLTSPLRKLYTNYCKFYIIIKTKWHVYIQKLELKITLNTASMPSINIRNASFPPRLKFSH